MRRASVLSCCLAALAACTTFPALDAAVSPESRNAAYPALLPIDQLLLATGPARTTDAAAAAMALRVARLKARAAAMQGPVTDPATRARLAAAIAHHAG
jgi:hypothetical protein